MDTIELAEVTFMRLALYRRFSAVEADLGHFGRPVAGDVFP